MGSQTRGSLVSEALLIMGNPSLTSRAQLAFNRKLRKVYSSWPWPFLQNRAPAVPLPAGSQGTLFGQGNGGVTLEVQRVIDPIFLYTADYSTQARVKIRQLYSGNLIEDETINNPATFVGQPQQFKVRQGGNWGVWNIIPTPFPDKAYLMGIDYIVQPADIAVGTGGDSVIPVYPNDETLIQMIVAEMLKYEAAGSDEADQKYQGAVQELNELLVQDRMRFGYAPGTNDQIGLDPAFFNAQVTPIVK